MCSAMSPAVRRASALVCLLAASSARSAEIPAGAALQGDTIDLRETGLFPGGGVMLANQAFDTLYIEGHGALSLRARLPEGARPRPLAELANTLLIAPLWGHAGSDCPAGHNEVWARDGALGVSWIGPPIAGCEGGVSARFAVELRPRAGGGVFVTFLYADVPPGRPEAPPRAGVALHLPAPGREVVPPFELFPDGLDAPSDRGKALLAGGSERLRVQRRGDPEHYDESVIDPGRWVIEVDGRGAVLGDGDQDGVRTGDNCEWQANPRQLNTDADRQGDVCDGDDDNDTLVDVEDNCPLVRNRDQSDVDGDGAGDACELDSDGDGILNAEDDCPLVADSAQLDLDGDGLGDACDPDVDGDGLLPPGIASAGAVVDACPYVYDDIPRDSDRDGIGDRCDRLPWYPCRGACSDQRDSDGDGIADPFDRCPTTPDPLQRDFDADGIGDACDADADGDGVLDLYAPCVACLPLTTWGRLPTYPR